jgi:hypothetical protein
LEFHDDEDDVETGAESGACSCQEGSPVVG